MSLFRTVFSCAGSEILRPVAVADMNGEGRPGPVGADFDGEVRVLSGNDGAPVAFPSGRPASLPGGRTPPALFADLRDPTGHARAARHATCPELAILAPDAPAAGLAKVFSLVTPPAGTSVAAALVR